jgi:hypothetical protein
MSTTL